MNQLTRGNDPSIGRGRLLVIVLIAMGVGAGITTTLYLARYRVPEARAPFGSTAFDIREFDPTDPNEALLQPGEKVSLQAADSAIGFPLIRPQNELASDGSLAEVWIGSNDAQEAAMRYESGLRAYLAAWPEGKDAAGFYKSSAAESGAGTFQEINGHPAWVVEANSQAPGFPEESFVLLTIDSVEITLQGPLPIESIVEVAGTVK